MDIASFPVSSSTLLKLLETIETNSKLGISSTFTFTPQAGGSRSWFKFLLHGNLSNQTHRSLSDFRLVELEPINCTDDSVSSFLSEFLHCLSPENPYPDIINPPQLVEQISQAICSSPKPLLVFLLKLDSFPNLNPTLGNLLYALWKKTPGKLVFCTTFSSNWELPHFSETLGQFSETLIESLTKIPLLSGPDQDQCLYHWESIFKLTLPPSVKNLIKKHSNGSGYLIKLMITRYAQNPSANLEKTFSDLSRQLIHLVSRQDFQLVGSALLLGNQPADLVLSPSEYQVSLLIFSNQSVTTRDQIAECIWGKNSFERYSDWAIDRLISTLRQKLISLNCSQTIKAIKGQGYKLIKV